MTVSNTTVMLQYEGDGQNRQFGITFPLLSAGHLRIVVTDENGAETEIVKNFTVSPQLNAVTYPTVESGLNPLPLGSKITILRKTPLTQEIDLQTGGALDAKELEGGYDKAILVAQELAAALDRAVKFPVSDTGETDAQAYLTEISEGVSSAAEQAELADSAAKQAEASLLSAREQAEAATNEADRAAQYATAAQNNQNVAMGAADSALNSAGKSAESEQNAAQSALEAKNALDNIKALKRSVLAFTAGTPAGSYDGGLKTFDTGMDLTDLAVVPYVNGQRKDEQEYVISGTSVVFSYNLRTGDRVVLELNGSIRTAKEADVEEEISAHNVSASAHPALEARVSALEESGTGGAAAEQYAVAQSGNWTASYLNSSHKTNFRSGNLGISGKTITRVEIVLGSGADGSPRIIFPCLTGWGDQSGNFVDIYHQFQAASWVFTDWYTDPENIPFEIRVYYK